MLRLSSIAVWVTLGGVLLGRVACAEIASGASKERDANDEVVIAVAGDVLPESSWSAPGRAEELLGAVREEFGRADLVFVNLEEPITSSGKVTPYKRRAEVAAGRDYILRARDPAIPRHMKEAGVGLVGLANNHMMDYASAGLRDTLRAFGEAGLPVVGAGLKPDAERAFIFEKRGRRIALLAFSDVVPRNFGATESRLGIASSKDDGDLTAAIRRARRRADFVVLMIHWGGQGRHLITPRQRQLARVVAEAGCDAVVGMHPHVLQGAEYVGHAPVFYSLGNFAFPSRRPAARESLLVRLVFSSAGLQRVELVPVEISPAGLPSVAGGERGREVLGHFDGFCSMFNSSVQEGALVPSAVRAQLVYDAGAPKGRRPARPGRSYGPSGGRRMRGS